MIHPFSKKQKQVLTWWMDGAPYADNDFLITEGAIRSGKTLSTIDSFINWSQTNFSDENFIVAGVSVGAVKRNVLEPLFSLLESKGVPYKWKEADKRLLVGSNTYLVFGANNDYAQDSIQGLTAAGLFMDEAPLMPRSFIDQAMGRCSRDGAKYFATLNPASPYHWFKTEWIDNAEEKNALVLKFTMDDNPDLSDRVKERYKRMFSGVFYQRYIEGKWVVAEGAVYDMFDSKKHVIDTMKNPQFYDEMIAAIDYATSSVMTFGLYGIKDDEVHLVKEYYYDAKKEGKQMTDQQQAERLKEFVKDWNVKAIYFDPSASSFAQTCRHNNIQKMRAAKNDVVNGIRTVATKLQEGKFFIDESCEDTLREIASYSWDPKAQERGEDRPVKKNDHAMDRDRYAIYTHFHKPTRKAISKPKGL